MFAAYQRAGRCTGTATPGAKALLAALLERFPTGRNGGIYNCRSIRGRASRSVHGEGRALDVMCSVATGRRIVAALLPKAGRLGVQAIIHDRRIYTARAPRGRFYGGVSPHRDHVHIELGRPAALHLNLRSARAILGGAMPIVVSRDGGPQGPFPLPAGHWYGPMSPDTRNHSGYWEKDRPAIQAIQREVGVPQTGRFDAITAAACSKWKVQNGHPSDPLIGQRTWELMTRR